ncbi:anti-anti-sigma factor [Ekhidna lutea]|uniref:Anti-anti-sigma factor n=1 Tax=Ekhidna lutea TaxID=447679 RepID=A0A239K1Q4_EKHLU|nr:STAS domain-containing protein [Ekhidna lutea]SNT11623.1 anti-anti-sigma factor [Ekhidna lutea]
MEFAVDKYENYSMAKINQEKVDSTMAPELKSEFMKLAQDGVKSLIVNMETVKYVDSSGLSALLVGNRSFGESGAFVLYNVTDHVMKLISISQLDKVMTVVKSQEEAADAVLLSAIQKGQGAAE